MYGSLREGSQPSGVAAASIDWIIAQTHHFSVGVALFFVISGYCIAAAADGARFKGTGSREYFLRRFRRIYPPFWVVVVASLVFFGVIDYVLFPGLLSRQPWGQPRPSWYSPTQWLGNLTLTETW